MDETLQSLMTLASQGYDPGQDLLAELLENAGGALRSLAVYHICELGLTHLRARIEAVDAQQSGFLEGVLEGAVGMLSQGAAEPVK